MPLVGDVTVVGTGVRVTGAELLADGGFCGKAN
jgi:hypothetical protein